MLNYQRVSLAEFLEPQKTTAYRRTEASGPMVGTNGKMIGRKTGKMNGRMIGRPGVLDITHPVDGQWMAIIAPPLGSFDPLFWREFLTVSFGNPTSIC